MTLRECRATLLLGVYLLHIETQYFPKCTSPFFFAIMIKVLVRQGQPFFEPVKKPLICFEF